VIITVLPLLLSLAAFSAIELHDNSLLWSDVCPPKCCWTIYKDKGVWPQSHNDLEKTLTIFDQNVQSINAEEVAQGNWQSKTKVFVMPGGQATEFQERLRGAANQEIKRFVADGGSYLGICGGAYYVSSFSQFDFSIIKAALCTEESTMLRVRRELSFFQGKCQGPVTPCRQVVVCAQGKKIRFPFNGGGSFIEDEHVLPPYKPCSVLAKFNDQSAAIIRGLYGKGLYILSAPHIEDLTLLEPRSGSDSDHEAFLKEQVIIPLTQFSLMPS